jgi:hypothetical protein
MSDSRIARKPSRTRWLVAARVVRRPLSEKNRAAATATKEQHTCHGPASRGADRGIQIGGDIRLSAWRQRAKEGLANSSGVATCTTEESQRCSRIQGLESNGLATRCGCFRPERPEERSASGCQRAAARHPGAAGSGPSSRNGLWRRLPARQQGPLQDEAVRKDIENDHAQMLRARRALLRLSSRRPATRSYGEHAARRPSESRLWSAVARRQARSEVHARAPPGTSVPWIVAPQAPNHQSLRAFEHGRIGGQRKKGGTMIPRYASGAKIVHRVPRVTSAFVVPDAVPALV